MGAAAVPAALLLTAAATGYQVYSSNQARKVGEEQAELQARQTEDLIYAQEEEVAVQKKKYQDESATAEGNQSRDSARARQKSKAMAAGGRRGTILTGPTGIQDTEEKMGKTLLGT